MPVAQQRGYLYVKCRGCGLVYMNPRPDIAALNELYNSYHGRNGRDEVSWDLLMKHNYRAVSGELEKRFPDRGRELDIGCGYGYFLDIMQSIGWEAEGIDPSVNTVERAQARGLNVTRTTIDDMDLPDERFHAVTLFYVLEHLTDPAAALRKVFDLLIPGGVAVVRVPHSTPLVRLCSVMGISNNIFDAPFHLFDFDPECLHRMLHNAGFDCIEITPGEPTVPLHMIERTASYVSGYTAKLIFHLTRGRRLLPGVSKTAIAVKPL